MRIIDGIGTGSNFIEHRLPPSWIELSHEHQSRRARRGAKDIGRIRASARQNSLRLVVKDMRMLGCSSHPVVVTTDPGSLR